MSFKKPRFAAGDVQILNDALVYTGFFKINKLQLRHRLFGGGWSEPIERELFVKAQAVAAVLYDPVNDLIGLVEQFRVGMLEASAGPWSLEGVAGMVEPGEDPEAVMRRELSEEAGLSEATLLPITCFYPTPGSCNESTYLYCALCDLHNAGGQFGLADEGEDIQLHVAGADEVFNAMLQSRMNNAATLIGLLWLRDQREALRAQATASSPNG